MKISHPIGLLVLGTGLGGFAAIFVPISPAAVPISPAMEAARDSTEHIAAPNEQDEPEIVIQGIGNSGNHFTFGQTSNVADVFADIKEMGPISDEMLYTIYNAVQRKALDGDADAARLVAEIAISQRDTDDEGKEDEDLKDDIERR